MRIMSSLNNAFIIISISVFITRGGKVSWQVTLTNVIVIRPGRLFINMIGYHGEHGLITIASGSHSSPVLTHRYKTNDIGSLEKIEIFSYKTAQIEATEVIFTSLETGLNYSINCGPTCRWSPGAAKQLYNVRKCSQRFYGLSCSKFCRCYRRQACDALNGFCKNGCHAGYYGPECQNICYCRDANERCSLNKDDVCVSGCKGGYTGSSCSDCRLGTFGDSCLKFCHCKNPNDSCTFASGTCKSGCEQNFDGPFCSQCDKGWFTINCSRRCYCRRDDDACDQLTGYCSSGCASGYTGKACNIPLRQTRSTINVPAVVCTAVLLITSLSFLLIICRFLRKKKENPELTAREFISDMTCSVAKKSQSLTLQPNRSYSNDILRNTPENEFSFDNSSQSSDVSFKTFDPQVNPSFHLPVILTDGEYMRSLAKRFDNPMYSEYGEITSPKKSALKTRRNTNRELVKGSHVFFNNSKHRVELDENRIRKHSIASLGSHRRPRYYQI